MLDVLLHSSGLEPEQRAEGARSYALGGFYWYYCAGAGAPVLSNFAFNDFGGKLYRQGIVEG